MQMVLNGLCGGFPIALLAVAFAAAYVPTRVFHVALAAVFSLAPYLVKMGLDHSVPWWAVIVSCVIVSAAVSMACEAFNHWPLSRRQAGHGVHMISSLGIMLIVTQAIALVWGNDPQVLSEGGDATWRWGSVVIVRSQAIILFVCPLVLAGFFGWLHFHDLGLWFRGVSENSTEMALTGYNIRRARLVAFAVAGGLAGCAGVLAARDVGFDPHGGLPALLLAVVAMVIGGRLTFAGPVFGGLILGLVRAEVTWHLSAKWQEAVTFALLGLFLLLRPQGLLGTRLRLEAEP